MNSKLRRWMKWCERRGLDPRLATSTDAAEYQLEEMWNRPLKSRHEHALYASKWYESEGLVSPFSHNPNPYPLRKRYLPWSFAEWWAWIRSQPDPERGWIAALALGRVAEGTLDQVRLEGRILHYQGRVVPVSVEASEWIRTALDSGFIPDLELPHSVRDLHGALQAELARRGIPEVTVAGLYGRWSAMKFEVATDPLSLFGLPLDGTEGGE